MKLINITALDASFKPIEVLVIAVKKGENALRKAVELYSNRADIAYFKWA